ncbi:MAG: carboxypeptidase regulatory-like domain-containing protein [Elusimicrobia bacterium]|nr:carboxypeptidase regulatory-like domain-containing protein [Elusimicrobiota bacterium]
MVNNKLNNKRRFFCSTDDPRPTTNAAGMTLVEIMIALAIVTTVFTAFSVAFGTIAKAIFVSKARTLASNLAQEKMQILKQLSYHNIMVTTYTYTRDEFDPDVYYDDGYYAPETIKEGGISFERLTYIQMAQEVNGEIQLLGATPDTGMKAITVTVIWKQSDEYKTSQIRSIASNPDLVQSNATIQGDVEITGTSTDIEGAEIVVAENIGWRDATDSGGDYSISLRPGSYNLTITARGYFTKSIAFTISASEAKTLDIDLDPMATGSISGHVWLNDHPVITTVVASSQPASMAIPYELIGVYNSSDYSGPINDNVVELRYRQKNTGGPAAKIEVDFLTSSITPWSYFLVASTTPVIFKNKSVNADAVYKATQDQDTIKNGSDGGLGLWFPDQSKYVDRVAWSDGVGADEPADLTEGTAMSIAGGLSSGKVLFRKMGPDQQEYWDVPGSERGRAYDTDNNAKDFYVCPDHDTYVYTLRNSTTTLRPVAGSLATGAIISATDGLSVSTNAVVVVNPSGCAYSTFTLTSVATGTWMVNIASGAYSLDIATVCVSANVSTSIPSGVTVSTWPYANVFSAILSEDNVYGYVSGWVKNVAGSAISPAIKVTDGFTETTANTSNGTYLLTLDSGTYNITANPNNTNTSYVSMTSQTVVITQGYITSGVNFTLSQGGRIYGFVTMDQEVTGSDDMF